MKGLPLGLQGRLSLILGGIAALATALAVLLQDRALSGDLEQAARARLDRAAAAADRLVADHLEGIEERYQAISRTPEFRANLEVAHAPTLTYYAERVASQEGAALLLFLDRSGEATAAAGEEGLIGAALHRDQQAPTLVAGEGRAFAVVSVPLHTRHQPLGRLVALEELTGDTITAWSELSGAHVSLAAAAVEAPGALSRSVRRLGGLEVRVAVTLDSEREALANARWNLLTAGAIALGLAFGVALLLARGLVRPIRAIQAATEQIGQGDLEVRLGIERRDELGDVARAFNLMLERLQRTLGRLRRSEAQLARAQRLARLGSWSFEIGGDELRCSREFRRIYALEPDRSVPLEQLFERVHPDDREQFRAGLERCEREGRPFRLDHRTVELDGLERILHSQAERVSRGDRPVRLEGTVQDITERKLVEDQVRYLAYHDNLTGLANRRLFKERLGLSIDEARRNGLMVGVLFLDLDGFKIINDTLGHSFGDRLLKAVADRLVKSVRANDIVTRASKPELAATVSRLGGDEFTVLLSGIRDPQQAGKIAREILRSLSEPFDVDGHEVAIGGSIGITTWPSDGDGVEALLRNCDTAMYHAKEQGRNNYQFYAESMNALFFKRLVIENRLRKAIERDDLELYYQPKVEIETGKVTGLEALVRWRDPELGVVPPNEFIPLAEETGLIGAIGEWVLRSAVRQIKVWQDAGLCPVRTSINLSSYQVEHSGFVAIVARVLHESGVDPQRLDVEITETALMKDESTVIASLSELRELGVSISLDDFGTGYSSLSYLCRLPIDTLKIDRSFIRRVETEADDLALIGAIISMARVLRLRVVVEGVETEEQRLLLLELGCDEIQGNLYSPPVPGGEVPKVLEEVEAAHRHKRKRKRSRQQRRTPGPGRGRRGGATGAR